MTPAKARAVWAIYVWCRRTDELVDGPNAARITPEVPVIRYFTINRVWALSWSKDVLSAGYLVTVNVGSSLQWCCTMFGPCPSGNVWINLCAGICVMLYHSTAVVCMAPCVRRVIEYYFVQQNRVVRSQIRSLHSYLCFEKYLLSSLTVNVLVPGCRCQIRSGFKSQTTYLLQCVLSP